MTTDYSEEQVASRSRPKAEGNRQSAGRSDTPVRSAFAGAASRRQAKRFGAQARKRGEYENPGHLR
jgi:hypothetical protein